MERAAAIIVGGVGVLILTIAAVFWVQSGGSSGPSISLGASVGELADVRTAGRPAEGAGSATSEATARSTTTQPTSTQRPSSTLGAPSTPTTSSVVPPTVPAAVTAPSTPATTAVTTLEATSAATVELLAVIERIEGGAIRFAYRSAELDPVAEQAIAELAAQLLVLPEVRVVVTGHTDSDGELAENVGLSARRAAAVIDRLAMLGIGRDRMVGVGAGESQPVASNDDPAGQQANRRVEVDLLPPGAGAG